MTRRAFQQLTTLDVQDRDRKTERTPDNSYEICHMPLHRVLGVRANRFERNNRSPSLEVRPGAHLAEETDGAQTRAAETTNGNLVCIDIPCS